MRWEVSTFEPTVAAFKEGESKVFGGHTNLIGAKHPWFSGMSDEIMDLRQYCESLLLVAADQQDSSGATYHDTRIHDRRRAVQDSKVLRTGSCEIEYSTPGFPIDVDLER